MADPIIGGLVTYLLTQALGVAGVGFTIGTTGITIGAAVTGLVETAVGRGLSLSQRR